MRRWLHAWIHFQVGMSGHSPGHAWRYVWCECGRIFDRRIEVDHP